MGETTEVCVSAYYDVRTTRKLLKDSLLRMYPCQRHMTVFKVSPLKQSKPIWLKRKRTEPSGLPFLTLTAFPTDEQKTGPEADPESGASSALVSGQCHPDTCREGRKPRRPSLWPGGRVLEMR